MALFLAYNEHNINDSEIIGFTGNIFEIIALKVFKIIVHACSNFSLLFSSFQSECYFCVARP